MKNHLRLPKKLQASKFKKTVVSLHQIYTHTAPGSDLLIACK